ncbi:MAG TPA: hypothetical protein PL070_20685, partial [Flavobacteriales bacterium]|nr:hypothetical protein [Flavobacteriales bacterium]
HRYEVRIRPNGDFNGMFASLVFTLRWSSTVPATLSEFTPTPNMLAIQIVPTISGEEVTSGEYVYAPFTAFSFTTLAAHGQTWVAGQEVSLGTIDVIGGPVELELVEDGWTSANNADFYISLGGIPMQGGIYSSPPLNVSIVDDPLANSDLFITWITGTSWLNVSSTKEVVLDYDLVEMAGRTVAHGVLFVQPGRSQQNLGLDQLPPGNYTVVFRGSTFRKAVRGVILN